jgi:hypothetical protein
MCSVRKSKEKLTAVAPESRNTGITTGGYSLTGWLTFSTLTQFSPLGHRGCRPYLWTGKKEIRPAWVTIMTTFQPACMLLGIRDRRDFFFKLGLKVYAIKIIWLFRHHFKLLLFRENTRIEALWADNGKAPYKYVHYITSRGKWGKRVTRSFHVIWCVLPQLCQCI